MAKYLFKDIDIASVLKWVAILSLLLFISPINSQSQPVGNQPFIIYVNKGRFNEKVRSYFTSHDVFDEIRLLKGHQIDPKKRGIIDIHRVERHLVEMYPNKNAQGVLVIDLENKLYLDLKDSYPGTREFENALEEFQSLVSFIKELRPGLRVGFYGLPFRVYYDHQYVRNVDAKLDRILQLADIIFPSLYIMYPDRQKGVKSNLLYLERNLIIAFEYAARLQKPVIPFVWHAVHPSNKHYGRNLISKQEMHNYITFIKNYRWETFGVAGVVWWEGNAYSNNKIVDRNEILFDYTRPYIE